MENALKKSAVNPVSREYQSSMVTEYLRHDETLHLRLPAPELQAMLDSSLASGIHMKEIPAEVPKRPGDKQWGYVEGVLVPSIESGGAPWRVQPVDPGTPNGDIAYGRLLRPRPPKHGRPKWRKVHYKEVLSH